MFFIILAVMLILLITLFMFDVVEFIIPIAFVIVAALGLIAIFNVMTDAADNNVQYTSIDLAKKLPDCPGVIHSYEKKVTYKYNTTDIIEAFTMKGWTNITIDKHVSNGFFDESYTMIRAYCEV